MPNMFFCYPIDSLNINLTTTKQYLEFFFSHWKKKL